MYAFSSSAFWVNFFRKFHCYYCGSEEGYASRRRNLFERNVLSWFALRPVRCGDCFRRSYLPVTVPVRARGEGLSASQAAAVGSLISSEKRRSMKEASGAEPTKPPQRVA